MRLKIFITLFLLVVGSVKVDAGSERFQPDWYKKLIASLFIKQREAKAIPQEPRYCFRCTSGTFDDHRVLMTGPIQYKLTTWREDWVETDCLQAKGTFQYCEGRCVFVTVSRHLQDQQTYQAEGVLSDCADDLFRWGTDLPFFMGDKTSDNETLKTYTDRYEITFDFTLYTTNYTEIYKRHVGQVLRRHVYETYKTSTVVIYIVVLVVIPFLIGFMLCWYCLLSIDDRLRRLNRRREYIGRILSYVPETDVIVELANHNAGGLTTDMMLTRIDEVDTQDSHEHDTQESHEYVNFTRKTEPDVFEEKTADEAVDVEEIESKAGEELVANDVVQELVQKVSESESDVDETFLLDEETANAYFAGDVDSDAEHYHREKLYTTEEIDIDDHETKQAIEIFEEPSDVKTINDAVQEVVYKIQEEEEKLNG
ncbi:hypothetical protein L3Y34_010758 [Caenorhabditis briggsae]|uniref:Uncharacterized protein n=2 Tax=Caenorhabditis briggsae TaxID=6238 RepID=A0AAE9CTI4_CAEBR|nr:hypothetical protein L3Y34_010758 [Caenorhabditis briggsae]